MEHRLQICLIFLVGVMLVMPSVLAETEITVLADPEHDLLISILDGNQNYYLFKSFTAETGSEGEATVTYSGEGEELDIGVTLKKDGEKISYEKFEGFVAGEIIEIDSRSDDYKAEIEEAEKAEAEKLAAEEAVKKAEEDVAKKVAEEEAAKLAAEEAESNSGLSGLVVKVGDIKNKVLQNIYYVLGLLVLLGAAAFVISKRGSLKLSAPSLPDLGFNKDKSLAEEKKEVAKEAVKKAEEEEEEIDERDDELMEAERKIAEAQKEIRRIKNRSKVKAVEKRLAARRKDLEEAEAELKKIEDGD